MVSNKQRCCVYTIAVSHFAPPNAAAAQPTQTHNAPQTHHVTASTWSPMLHCHNSDRLPPRLLHHNPPRLLLPPLPPPRLVEHSARGCSSSCRGRRGIQQQRLVVAAPPVASTAAAAAASTATGATIAPTFAWQVLYTAQQVAHVVADDQARGNRV